MDEQDMRLNINESIRANIELVEILDPDKKKAPRERFSINLNQFFIRAFSEEE